MENILWNTWQYLVDVFDCFLILYLFRKMMRTRLRQLLLFKKNEKIFQKE